MEEFIEAGATFGFESTLSGMGYLKRIRRMKERGYRIVLSYLKLPSPDVALGRVRSRVLEGGHDIPEEDLRRRFAKSWKNFESVYQPIADTWIVFDNSGDSRNYSRSRSE